jgi:hypothetical protein
MTSPAEIAIQAQVDELIAAIAKQHLLIETLETRKSDRLDFHEVAVWGVKDALEAAYRAGRQAAMQEMGQE